MLATLFLQSCTTSENHVLQTVRNHIKENLYNPNSYSEKNVKIDSIYSVDGSLNAILGFMEVVDMIPEIKTLSSDMQMAKTSMSIWGDGYVSSYDSQQYDDAKEKYNALLKKTNNLKEKIRERMQYYISDRFSEEKNVLAGYYIEIGYSCKALNGNELPGFSYLIYSIDLEKVVYEKSLTPIEMVELMVGDEKPMIQKVLEYVDDFCHAGEEFNVDDFISYISL